MNRLFKVDLPDKGTDKYTKKITAPQYLPNNTKPVLDELYNAETYSKLVRDIKMSNVTLEEKEFLLKAATRHIVFNYAKIADYYAHSSKELQELMEQSALVIIDFDDAVANGYVRLSKAIDDIISGTKND